MQKYHSKTVVALIGDHLLRFVLACLVGVAWFLWLWGMQITTISAGIALGGLLWLMARQFGKLTTQKREQQMRRMIGGELALSRLLLMHPRHAGFQAALWIAPRFPVVMQKAVEWGVMGTLNGTKTMVKLIAQHESIPVSVQQIIEVAREMKKAQIDQCILCLTAPASPQALGYIEDSASLIQLVSREDMITFAGRCHPATDEQLSKLRKKRSTLNRRQLLDRVLDSSRARRYFWYGIGLSAMALITGQRVYPIPAFICLCLFALCKLQPLLHGLGARVGKRNPFRHG